MALAMEEARKAERLDEVPVGAVIADPLSQTVMATSHNLTRVHKDPTAHAEILAIRAACLKAEAQRIPDYDLYVTLEPCAMCAGAISFARIRRLIFAADDAKGGGVIHGAQFFDQPTCHHRPQVQKGINAEESTTLLQNFFVQKRGIKRPK